MVNVVYPKEHSISLNLLPSLRSDSDGGRGRPVGITM